MPRLIRGTYSTHQNNKDQSAGFGSKNPCSGARIGGRALWYVCAWNANLTTK